MESIAIFILNKYFLGLFFLDKYRKWIQPFCLRSRFPADSLVDRRPLCRPRHTPYLELVWNEQKSNGRTVCIKSLKFFYEYESILLWIIQSYNLNACSENSIITISLTMAAEVTWGSWTFPIWRETAGSRASWGLSPRSCTSWPRRTCIKWMDVSDEKPVCIFTSDRQMH